MFTATAFGVGGSLMKRFNQDVIFEDARYKIAHKEALIGILLAIFHFIWWYAFAYGLGKKDVTEYTYIFGFPAWFFYSCIVGFVFIFLLVWLVVKWLFVEIPLDEEEPLK